jgi:hypothetical protein
MAEGTEEKRKLTEISSFIGDLPSTVQKFWSGVAEPFFELSIALIVVFFVLGGDKKIEEAISTQLSAAPQISLGDSYGIKALIPVAVLIFLVGIAQGVSKLLRVIGSAIPGQLVPNRISLFLKNGKPSEVAEAWQYTQLGTVEDLNNEIDATIARPPLNAANDTLSKIRVLQGQSEAIMSTASFIKGLFVTTVVIAVVVSLFALRPLETTNLAIVFVFTIVALIYLAYARVQSEREYASQKAREYSFQKKVLGVPSKEYNPQKLAEVEQARRDPDREAQWKLNLIPKDVGRDLQVLGSALLRMRN